MVTVPVFPVNCGSFLELQGCGELCSDPAGDENSECRFCRALGLCASSSSGIVSVDLGEGMPTILGGY